MKRQKPKKNGTLFVILALIVVVVIILFTFFIYLFTKYDKTEYDVAVGSVVYDVNKEYIKTEGEAYITQKFDRNYYLYEKKNNDLVRYDLGKNAVVYKDGDMYIYIYGTAYQILTSGDVDTLSGQTKVVKSQSTKFFKLDDREYLIVDKSIQDSEGKGILNTKDYVLVSIDKKGNPSFSNHLVDFKTIKQMSVVTSVFGFDIANEKLIYEKKEIDLKNIIGSSNEYEPPKEEKKDYTDEKLDAIQNNISDNASAIVGYYDQYFNDVVSSVNNLTQSVIGVNNNTIASLSKGEVYYDFECWLALKSVNANIASIDVTYSIFDPTNEYQSAYLIVDGPVEPVNADDKDPDEVEHNLSKSGSTYTIRDLKPSTQYQITLVYIKSKDPDVPIYEDTIVTTTKSEEYDIKVTKISFKEKVAAGQVTPESYVEVEYEMDVGVEYRFSKASMYLERYNSSGFPVSDPIKITDFQGNAFESNGVYKTTFKLDPGVNLGDKNILVVKNLEFCTGVPGSQSCDESEITFDYTFFNEKQIVGNPDS